MFIPLRSFARGAVLASLVVGHLSLVRAAEIAVSDAAALAAALARAKPGDTLVLTDGTWRDAEIKLTAAGTPEAPITVRARTPGAVVLTGGSSLTFAAPHVRVDGLFFRGGALPRGSVITFASDHCRLTNTAIVDYNPAEVATAYYWVFFNGNFNRMEHCYLAGKSHQEPVVGNAIRESRHNVVARCHFKSMPYVPNRNGREVFRVWGYGGNEELGTDGAFFTIEDNLFEEAHGEGAEIISLKSNRNVVRNNTIVRTRGGITNRSGNFNTITGNIILCDRAPGAYGMRITGQFHTIAHNVVVRGEYGIHLMAGEYIERDLTGSYEPIKREGTPLGRVPAYNQPKHTLVAENLLIDNEGVDLLIGSSYKSGWPRAQRVLLPESNELVGNVVVKKNGGVAIDAAVPDRTTPLDQFAFGQNFFAGNIVHGGAVRLQPAPAADAVRVMNDEPAAAREALGRALLRALRPEEVGPAWVRAQRAAGEETFQTSRK